MVQGHQSEQRHSGQAFAEGAQVLVAQTKSDTLSSSIWIPCFELTWIHLGQSEARVLRATDNNCVRSCVVFGQREESRISKYLADIKHMALHNK